MCFCRTVVALPGWLSPTLPKTRLLGNRSWGLQYLWFLSFSTNRPNHVLDFSWVRDLWACGEFTTSSTKSSGPLHKYVIKYLCLGFWWVLSLSWNGFQGSSGLLVSSGALPQQVSTSSWVLVSPDVLPTRFQRGSVHLESSAPLWERIWRSPGLLMTPRLKDSQEVWTFHEVLMGVW